MPTHDSTHQPSTTQGSSPTPHADLVASLATMPADAADRIEPELAALAEADLAVPNIDVSAAAGVALSVWPSFSEYLPQIERSPDIDVALIRKIPDYAWTLKFWNSATLYEAAPSPALAALADKGYAIRERLLADLGALAGHGYLESTLLTKFAGTSSHQKLSDDLLGLAKLVPERWDVIQGRSAITLDAATEASDVGAKLAIAVGGRDRTPAAIAHAQKQRLRAYTLFVRAYDEARRAIGFLRWHEGDGDAILPSVFTVKRSARRRGESEQPATDLPATELAAAPVASVGAGSSPLLGVPVAKASASDPFAV